MLGGALSGSAMAQAPDAGWALPTEPKGIPAAIDAAISGPADILASQVRIEIIDPRDSGARYCLRAYFEELGRRFETGFDPAQSISASDEEMTLPNGLLLVATLLGTAVGCGALKLHIDTQMAEVKRMWVASDVRGLGLGRRVLERLSAEAASRGMLILRL